MAALFLSFVSLRAENLPAFPGAEGFGRYAVGGRGGSIYHVTNLNDSGSGSFRDAVTTPNRIVVFDVSGVIRLQSALVFAKNLTILGQTAPGEGVQIYGDRVSFSGADNIIVRYMRIRMGVGGTSGKDAAGIANGKNMIFDHMSVLWGRDECFSVSWDKKGTEPTNITIQNSIIGQGLQTHSCGGLIQTNGGVTLFRNLYIENKTRNPKVKGLNQYINNVVYNWGNGGCYIMGDTEASSWADIQNNYFIKGPWNGASAPFTRGTATFTYYGSGNYYDANKNGLVDGELVTSYAGSTAINNWNTWDNKYRPQAHPAIASMTTAQEALQWVVDSVGPVLPVRDQVDQYLIDELISYGKKGSTDGITTEKDLPHKGTGVLYGGFKPKDSDGDAIPDEWELAHGLNPNDASDAAKIAANGYANIENYSFSIHAAYPYLKSPSNLKVSNISKTSAELTWSDNASNETAYVLEYSTDGKNYTVLAHLDKDVVSYTMNDLNKESTYYVRVYAKNENLQSPYSAVLRFATQGDAKVPLACEDPSPANNSAFGLSGTFSFSWTNNSPLYGGELSYTVYMGTHPDSMNVLIKGWTSNRYSFANNMKANQTYYWRVDTKNSIGETQGELWRFQTKAGETLFYTDFDQIPSAWAAQYGSITDNTNIINAANTTKSIGGMTFGTGSNSIRILSMSGACMSTSASSDYGPYSDNDAGASARCVQFYTTSSGAYLKLPEVQGPCVITLYLGNPEAKAKTVNLNAIVSNKESTVLPMSMAAAKRMFKYRYVYEGNEKITFKIDANAKKFNINDILIESYVPETSLDPIAFVSKPDSLVSYADGSMKFSFNQSIRYHGGLTINGQQYEQVKAVASGKELTVSYVALAADTRYELQFQEGALTDYDGQKDFRGSFAFSTCDFPRAKESGDTHYGKAASKLPLNFKPFNETAPYTTEGGLVQSTQKDYPHWVQAGNVTANAVSMTSTSDKLMAYFNDWASVLYLKADYSGSGNVVFKIQESRNPDISPYWRTICQLTAADFPIDKSFDLDPETRFVKISAPTLSSGSIQVTAMQLSDDEGNLPASIQETKAENSLRVYVKDGRILLEKMATGAHIRIYDTMARMCYDGKTTDTTLGISLPSGVYLICADKDNKRIDTIKVMVP